MSVNLNKQSKQSRKVSLQKEELKKETKAGQSTEAGDAGKESEKRLLFRIGLPIVAMIIILSVCFAAWSNRTKEGGGISRPAISEEVKTSEGNVDEIAESKEGTDVQDPEEDSRSMEEAEGYNETGNEEASIDAANSSQQTDDASIHNYEVIVADVTWSEAFADCIARGGYLCRINSAEENERIKELLMDQNIRGVVYIGGMRSEDSNEYHWIDINMDPYDEVINEGEYAQFWYDGEPSYVDYVDEKEIIESYMALIYLGATKEWVWNDVCDDVLSLAPVLYSGKLSYICEYE